MRNDHTPAESVRERINDFLAQRRIAFVGIARDPKDFSRGLYRALRARGYEVIPVNPNVQDIEEQKCFARVQDISPPVDGALVMTPPSATDQVVRDCAAAGIPRVWLHRGGGMGAVTKSAIEYCTANNISVVPGFCPYMFLPQTLFFHKMHGWFTRVH